MHDRVIHFCGCRSATASVRTFHAEMTCQSGQDTAQVLRDRIATVGRTEGLNAEMRLYLPLQGHRKCGAVDMEQWSTF
jgi:hypothetical protein